MIRRIVGLGLMLGAMLLLLAQLVRLAATGPAVAVAGPAAPASGPAAPASGPDLSVTLEVLDAQPLGIGAPLRLRLVVANGGTAVITQSFITRVYLNPSVVMSGSVTGAAFDSATLPGLGAGAQEVLTLTTHFIAGVGDHVLVAMVDAQQVITEADELNNVSAPAALRIDNDAALQRMDVPGLATNRHTNGVLNVQTLGIFGPDSCTTFGDAFSPLASPFAPGVYSYTYRIRIPADYAHDVVRVELFDPDSMNAATNTATVIHTNLAVSLGDPPSENLSCSGNVSQVQPCLINTGELNLAGVTLDTINPYWFMRIDENRTGGVNNSGCGAPATYTPADNTQTRFALYYLADGAGGPQPVPLAAYTGQVADGVRDSGAHQTDLRWVAPGAPLSYDQPAGVPTECGSPNGGDFDPVTCPGGTPARTGSGFEVSLSQAAPDIVTDLATGDRYLYLDVTALSGASENVFNVWAGPPIYVNSISSDVNVRNLQILNNPGAHDAGGLAVFGVDYLAVNNLHAARMAYPLLTLGPEFAGETLEISLFDSDAGAQPPITFYFDTIASSDYSISFTNEGGRCAPGSCNNLWVTPPYTLTVPDLAQCDWQNPDPLQCTPFYGGRLMASIQAGTFDTYVRYAAAPTAVHDPVASCSAFPIGMPWTIQSATPPGSGGTHDYPAAADFGYPPQPPAYTDFPRHRPDVPLAAAQPGDVFLVYQGTLTDSLAWLGWNDGIAATAATLANSLTWPGDTLDYTDHGDGGQPATPLYPWVVRGYVNPVDASDVTLGEGDWLPASTGSLGSAAVLTALQAHISQQRVLRLPVWDAQQAGSLYQARQFGLFRLHGYRGSQPGVWLLLEFAGWDSACGQRPAPASVALAGPASGWPAQPAAFVATVSPASVAVPLTYTWQAAGQPPLVRTGGVTDTAVFTWMAAGVYTVSVTVENGFGPPVTAVADFFVPWVRYLPVAWRP